MNSDHQLDAPSEDALRSVEQLEDHSTLSAMYPTRATPWDGTIMTADEREAKQQKAADDITVSLRRHFVSIGLLTVLPFLLAGAVGASAMEIGLFASTESETKALLAAGTIIIGGAWVITSFMALRKVVHLFYDHAMRAAPFIVMLLVLTGISLQSFFILTLPYHQAQPLLTVAAVGLATILWSIMLSFALLWIWTSPRISGNLRVAYIGILAMAIVAASTVIGVASIFVR